MRKNRPALYFADETIILCVGSWDGVDCVQRLVSSDRSPISSLPPERFSFEVINMSLQ
jgi:hypothetical protein